MFFSTYRINKWFHGNQTENEIQVSIISLSDLLVNIHKSVHNCDRFTVSDISGTLYKLIDHSVYFDDKQLFLVANFGDVLASFFVGISKEKLLQAEAKKVFKELGNEFINSRLSEECYESKGFIFKNTPEYRKEMLCLTFQYLLNLISKYCTSYNPSDIKILKEMYNDLSYMSVYDF
jgi:hypothetical protein